MLPNEIHEEITRLDDLIFKVETGQVEMSWDKYQELKSLAEELTATLAQMVAAPSGRTVEEAYEAREQVRNLDRISAMAARHLELHPEDANKENPLLIEAFRGEDEASKKAYSEFIATFDYMFANAPKPPEKQKRFIRKLFRFS